MASRGYYVRQAIYNQIEVEKHRKDKAEKLEKEKQRENKKC